MQPADLLQQALQWQQAGDLAAAEAAYRRLLQLEPGHVDATFHLGNILARRGQLADAQTAYRRALAFRPDAVHVLHNLGVTLLQTGGLVEARRCWDAALRLNPADPKLWFHHGLVSAQLGDFSRALDSGRRAVALKPEFAEAHNLCGAVLRDLGRDQEAETSLREAVRLKSDFAPALNNYGLTMFEAGRNDEAIALFRRAVAGVPKTPEDHSNLLMALNYGSHFDPMEILTEHRRWAERYADALAPATPPAPLPGRTDGRLRVGYVSADFRAHAMASFITAFLPGHDRRRVHVTAYSDVNRPDDTTARIQGMVDCWRPIHGQPHDAVARQVRADGIDVLVDLGGHTAGNRMLVFARRPAPLQVTMFGYQNTTGLKTMQYRISDALADPPGMTESTYTERVHRLPEIGWCYAPPEDAPPAAPPPALRSGQITFGSLNNLAKVTDEVIAAWVRILHALPQSRLVILVSRTQLGRTRIEELFDRAGIDRERVELVPRMPRRDYFGLFQGIDVALDPFPYNGATTSCDTLWMGVPFVTLAGSICRGRQGLCLLTHVGLSEFVANSVAEYVRIAQDCAGDVERLRGLRGQLRERVRSSPVAQGRRFAASLEEAYGAMFRETGL